MANGLAVRQNAESVEQNAKALGALRDGYSKMQALSATDNRSWIFWCGYHGFSQWQCWHHGRVGFSQTTRPYNLFLPWHRAYLLNVEHAVRDQNNDAMIPWWDWTSDQSHSIGIPRSFSQPSVNGARNSLFNGPVPATNLGPARQSVRFPGNPSELPTKQDIKGLLDPSSSSFVDFQAQLEDVHDGIHGWVGGLNPNPSPNAPQGGDMGSVATAAFDPIFWSHHCMIDRLWYLWQLRNGINNIPDDYLNRPLAPFALTVRDVLDVNKLGYEYAQTTAIAGNN